MAEHEGASITEQFRVMKDSRMERTKRHSLNDILVVAIDGKELRRSFDKAAEAAAIHVPEPENRTAETPTESAAVLDVCRRLKLIENDRYVASRRPALPAVLNPARRARDSLFSLHRPATG